MRKSFLLLALFCAACSNYSANLPSIKPFRMDISQGNVVTPKMMMQLRPGMSKAQVKFIMGTPLVMDAFHANRWDYFYQMRKDGKIVEQRRVIMEFENEKLARIRGDVIPAASAGGEGADKPANKAPVTLKSASDPKPKEKGLLDSLKFWGDDEAAAVPAVKPETAPAAQPAKPAAPEAAKAAPEAGNAAPEAVKAAPEAGKMAPDGGNSASGAGQAAPAPADAPATPPAPPAEPAPSAAAAPEVKPPVAEPPAPVAEPPAPMAEPPAPVAEPKAASTAAPEPQTSAPAPRSESSGAQIRLQPKPQQDPLPVIEPKPAAKVAPVSPPLPEAAKPDPSTAVAAPAAAPAPARKAVETAAPRSSAVEPKAVPKPADDLPPEDAPDYFERMLEKIGF